MYCTMHFIDLYIATYQSSLCSPCLTLCQYFPSGQRSLQLRQRHTPSFAFICSPFEYLPSTWIFRTWNVKEIVCLKFIYNYCGDSWPRCIHPVFTSNSCVLLSLYFTSFFMFQAALLDLNILLLCKSNIEPAPVFSWLKTAVPHTKTG